MADHTETKCPKCGQQLRIPGHIGGMLMACPTCGQKFYSDFKLGPPGSSQPLAKGSRVFGMPYELMRRFCRYFLP
jgi:DNA-directed RNA polymerase subunit RPC12/RpoP